MEIDIEEYERLKKLESDEPKLCLGQECPYQKIHYQKKFSKEHLKTGIAKLLTTPAVWVFIVTTVIYILFSPKEIPAFYISLCSVAFICIFYKQIGNLINKGNLNANFNAGVGIQRNINQ